MGILAVNGLSTDWSLRFAVIQKRIQRPFKYLKMSLFAKMVNVFQPLTIFARKLHRRCLTVF